MEDITPPQNEQHNAAPTPNLWDRFRASPLFPIASIAFVAIIVIGIGFAAISLLGRFGSGPTRFQPVTGPKDVAYQTSGEAALKIDVPRAAYASTYRESKPLAEGRMFVVVNLSITNDGTAASGPFTREDVRLITPDGSIMPPSSWSQGFLDIGIAPGKTMEGDVVFDIDPRNSQKPLEGFQIAFGKSFGNRATYQLTAR